MSEHRARLTGCRIRAPSAQKDGDLAPQRKLADEKPMGEIVDYAPSQSGRR